MGNLPPDSYREPEKAKKQKQKLKILHQQAYSECGFAFEFVLTFIKHKRAKISAPCF
jgi:hypothetical protein